jgi:PAS domain S-box-containing protein
MLDSNLICPSEQAIPPNFDLLVPYIQCESQRPVRNPRAYQRDEGRGKRSNDRVRNETVDRGAIAKPVATEFEQALRLDEQERVNDEVERRVAERTRELSEANKELQLQAGLLQHLPVSAWTLKPDGTPDFVNQVWLDFAGQTLDFVRSHPEAWMNAVHPEDREKAAKAFWEGVRKGQGFGFETRSLRAKDGTYRWHLQQAVVLRDGEGNVVKFVGTTTDIDDQKRAEEKLRRSEAFLAQGQRLSQTGTFSRDVETGEITFSETLYNIFEFDPGVPVALGRIKNRVHPEDLPVLLEKVALSRRETDDHDFSIRLLMADGRVKYLRAKTRGVRHLDGRLERIGAIQDVTERRLADETLGKLRSELAHMAKVTSLGALAASIAHEVNQPLAGVVTNAGICLRTLASECPGVQNAREAAQRILRDGNRASEIVARLRTLFTRKEAAAECIDLNDAVREVIALCADDMQRTRVMLRQEFADGLPRIMADRVQLQQVIFNLIRNASDAMSGVDDRQRVLVIKTEKGDDEGVRLSVRDTGMGIKPEDMERLFEAFFTTKGDGMGMGLSVSRSIIESHSGRLWATSNDGPGATFSFSIPSRRDDVGKIETAGQVGCHGAGKGHGNLSFDLVTACAEARA